MKRQAVLFFGPPGAGKGAISQLCVSRLGWLQLSTGNLCRQHIAENTPVGKEIDFAIKSGNLISDTLVVNMVDDWLSHQADGQSPIIFDGYPRSVSQAQLFVEMLVRKHTDLRCRVLKFCVLDDVLVRRLSDRVICKNPQCQAVYSLTQNSPKNPKKHMVCDLCGGPLVQREDDAVETVRKRLQFYREHESELLTYFNAMHVPITDIDASRPLEDVFIQVQKAFGV